MRFCGKLCPGLERFGPEKCGLGLSLQLRTWPPASHEARVPQPLIFSTAFEAHPSSKNLHLQGRHQADLLLQLLLFVQHHFQVAFGLVCHDLLAKPWVMAVPGCSDTEMDSSTCPCPTWQPRRARTPCAKYPLPSSPAGRAPSEALCLAFRRPRAGCMLQG